MNTTRRGFLLTAAAGAGAALAAQRAWARDRVDQAAADASGRLGRSLRASYGLDPAITYFNHASIGTTPLVVLEARERYLRLCETNPWLYLWGGQWEDEAQSVRADLARVLHCDADELAIVRTTTEAMNVLASGLDLGGDDEVLFGSENHIGASACFEYWGKRRGYRVRHFGFPLLETPSMRPDDIVSMYADQIRDDTRLLVLPHIDNMVGLNHPVKRIVRMARQRGVQWIAVDGAQAVGMIDVDVRDLDVDFYATSAHKWLQTPKGFGLLYARRDLLDRIEPMMVTWGQKRWKGTARKLEDWGTRDLASILALGDAVRFQDTLGWDHAREHRETLRARCHEQVDASNRLIWRSPTDSSLAAPIVAVEVKGRKSGDVFKAMFDGHGYVFRPFADHGLNTLRLSFNAMNDAGEIDRLFELIGV